MDIFSTLQEDKIRLSPSETRIADILLNNFEFAVNASIIELAEKADVSPPTVTRFCRRLGCESFSDFKVQLARIGDDAAAPAGLQRGDDGGYGVVAHGGPSAQADRAAARPW